MKRKSARMLGEMIGKTAAEVNKLLNEKGYLSGEPGNWSMTDEGRIWICRTMTIFWK